MSAVPCAHVAADVVQHGWLYDWQTLITGALAVVAALSSGYLIWQQTQVQKDFAADARRRRLRVAQATLPATLSAICEHATIVARTLSNHWPTAALLYPSSQQAATHHIVADLPILSPTATESLGLVMEHADDEAVIERIASIFREAQVLDTRTRELHEGADLSLGNLSEYIVEAAALYARAESLFGFARGQNTTVDTAPLWDRVSAALFLIGVRHDAVLQLVKAMREQGLPPGNAETLRASL